MPLIDGHGGQKDWEKKNYYFLLKQKATISKAICTY
jgi:hypothetical protein